MNTIWYFTSAECDLYRLRRLRLFTRLAWGIVRRSRQSSLSVRIVLFCSSVHEISENVAGVKARGGVTATRMRVESFNF